MTALMKRLSLSAEDKERSAAVSEIVDLVKKSGVAALKVCLVLFRRYCVPLTGSSCPDLYDANAADVICLLSCEFYCLQSPWNLFTMHEANQSADFRRLAALVTAWPSLLPAPPTLWRARAPSRPMLP